MDKVECVSMYTTTDQSFGDLEAVSLVYVCVCVCVYRQCESECKGACVCVCMCACVRVATAVHTYVRNVSCASRYTQYNVHILVSIGSQFFVLEYKGTDRYT